MALRNLAHLRQRRHEPEPRAPPAAEEETRGGERLGCAGEARGARGEGRGGREARCAGEQQGMLRGRRGGRFSWLVRLPCSRRSLMQERRGSVMQEGGSD